MRTHSSMRDRGRGRTCQTAPTYILARGKIYGSMCNAAATQIQGHSTNSIIGVRNQVHLRFAPEASGEDWNEMDPGIVSQEWEDSFWKGWEGINALTVRRDELLDVWSRADTLNLNISPLPNLSRLVEGSCPRDTCVSWTSPRTLTFQEVYK